MSGEAPPAGEERPLDARSWGGVGPRGHGGSTSRRQARVAMCPTLLCRAERGERRDRGSPVILYGNNRGLWQALSGGTCLASHAFIALDGFPIVS